MARTVEDLRISLQAMAGPDRWNTPAWKLEFPPSRSTTLEEFRIGAWIDDDFCPVASSTRSALESLCDLLRVNGAHVDDQARPEFTLEKASRVFNRLLGAALSGEYPVGDLDKMASDSSEGPQGAARRASAMRHREWLTENERRLQLRLKLEHFFNDFDAIIMPVQPRAAIKHDHRATMHERTVDIDGIERSYMELFNWIAPAGLGLLPATVVPVGFDDEGLPIGVQIVGPYLHDMTTLRLAELIAEMTGGCPHPPLAL